MKNTNVAQSRCYQFKREEHLKGRARIQEVFNKGRQFVVRQNRQLEQTSSDHQSLKLFVLENNLPYNRICFSCSGGRKFGNAVERNRAKRLGRESYRLIKGGFPENGHEPLKSGYDLILLIRRDSSQLNKDSGKRFKSSLSVMIEQLRILFKKAGLFKSK